MLALLALVGYFSVAFQQERAEEARSDISKIDDRRREAINLKRELRDLRRDRDELKPEIATRNNKKAELDVAIASQQQRKRDLGDELARLTQRRDEARTSLKDEGKEYNDLRKQVTDAKVNLNNLALQENQAKENTLKALGDLAEAEDNLKIRIDDLDKINSKVNNKKSRLDILIGSIEQRGRQLSQINGDIKSNNTLAKAAGEEFENLLAKVKTERGTLSNLQTQRDIKAEPTQTPCDSTIAVLDLVLARDVVDREPIGKTAEFSSGYAQAFAFARLRNDGPPVRVSFVWYQADAVISKFEVKVGTSAGWRTWSKVKIQPGRWRVELVTGGGQVLGDASFSVQ